MAEDADKQEENKLDFDLAGEAVAYISLDQARVLALQHARDNRDFYGRYADRDLVWELIGAEETEDYYEVRLSYRPAGNFRSSGVEQFTIDKVGPIELRQIVSEPQPTRRFVYLTAIAAVLAAAAIISGLVATGVLTSGDAPPSPNTIATPEPDSIASLAVVPTQTPNPTPLPKRFKIVGIIVPTPLPPGTPLPQFWRLETAVRPEGSGIIEFSPPAQEQLYFQGDSVDVIANCDSGFIRWEGDVPAGSDQTKNPLSITMDKPRVLYAFCVAPASEAYSAGAELNSAGEYESAIEKLSEAIRLNPLYAPAYSTRGSAYRHTGQSQAAIQDYDEAIRLAPENPNLFDDYYNRASVYQTIGQYQQAIQDFTQAIRLNPLQAYLYESRALAYDELGEDINAQSDRDLACQVDKTFCKVELSHAPAALPAATTTAVPALAPTPTAVPTAASAPVHTPTPTTTPAPPHSQAGPRIIDVNLSSIHGWRYSLSLYLRSFQHFTAPFTGYTSGRNRYLGHSHG